MTNNCDFHVLGNLLKYEINKIWKANWLVQLNFETVAISIMCPVYSQYLCVCAKALAVF